MADEQQLSEEKRRLQEERQLQEERRFQQERQLQEDREFDQRVKELNYRVHKHMGMTAAVLGIVAAVVGLRWISTSFGVSPWTALREGMSLFVIVLVILGLGAIFSLAASRLAWSIEKLAAQQKRKKGKAGE